ncbi:MAG: flagellar assembly protein FliW [Quinella sp. 3Q1]|nr:flagellar assembly protein FliW [Quinella sp. 3Q1]MBR6888342.1 flagellar assembly protein FliW [Selenomonadaceae bacterium]
MRKIYTSRFGEIEVDEKKIVHFKDGIPAFEEEHEFVILPYEEESPYYFMQSLKSPDLAFLLTIPFLFFNDYTFEIDDSTIKELEIKNSDSVFYYSMVTIPNGSIRYMTANLVAPIVLNAANMQAKQVVLEKSNYTTKHRLFPEAAKKEG